MAKIEILQNVLREMAVIPVIWDKWSALNNWYEHLGFKDDISDNERIEEYSQIVELLSSFTETILKACERASSLKEVGATLQAFAGQEAILKGSDEICNRATLTYVIMRNDWLFNLAVKIDQIVDELDKEEDDGSYS